MRSPLSLWIAKRGSSQPLITCPVFVDPDRSGCPLPVSLSFSRSPLNRVSTAGHSLFQVWCHQCWPEEKRIFLGYVVHGPSEFGLLWSFSVCTGQVCCWLLFSLESAIPQILFRSFQLLPSLSWCVELFSPSYKMLSFSLCHDISVCPAHLFCKVPLDSGSSAQHVNYSSLTGSQIIFPVAVPLLALLLRKLCGEKAKELGKALTLKTKGGKKEHWIYCHFLHCSFLCLCWSTHCLCMYFWEVLGVVSVSIAAHCSVCSTLNWVLGEVQGVLSENVCWKCLR